MTWGWLERAETRRCYIQSDLFFIFFCCGAATQRGSWPPHSRGFLDHTRRCSTVGRTPPDEWSARRRDLYLTTHNTYNRQTSMSTGGTGTHDLSRRADADLRLRPSGHWDRHNTVWYSKQMKLKICHGRKIFLSLAQQSAEFAIINIL